MGSQQAPLYRGMASTPDLLLCTVEIEGNCVAGPWLCGTERALPGDTEVLLENKNVGP